MTLLKVLVGAVSLAALLYGTTSEAWARAGGGDPGPSCLVENPGAGAIALRGTVAVDVTSGVDAGSNQDIDVTLSLDRGGVQQFFRSHQVLSLNGLGYDTVLCAVLDPSQVLAPQILSTFEFPSTSRLVITQKSISNADAVANGYFCVDAGCTMHHWSNIADVTIYILK